VRYQSKPYSSTIRSVWNIMNKKMQRSTGVYVAPGPAMEKKIWKESRIALSPQTETRCTATLSLTQLFKKVSSLSSLLTPLKRWNQHQSHKILRVSYPKQYRYTSISNLFSLRHIDLLKITSKFPITHGHLAVFSDIWITTYSRSSESLIGFWGFEICNMVHLR